MKRKKRPPYKPSERWDALLAAMLFITMGDVADLKHQDVGSWVLWTFGGLFALYYLYLCLFTEENDAH